MTLALGKKMDISPESFVWCAGGEPRCPFLASAAPVPRAGTRANAPPKDARDWLTTFAGNGRVSVRVTNASGNDIVLRLKSDAEISGQAGVRAGAVATFLVDPGAFDTLVKVSPSGDEPKYYRGPGLEVPGNASEVDVTLKLSVSSNLREVSPEEFEK